MPDPRAVSLTQELIKRVVSATLKELAVGDPSWAGLEEAEWIHKSTAEKLLSLPEDATPAQFFTKWKEVFKHHPLAKCERYEDLPVNLRIDYAISFEIAKTLRRYIK